MNSSGNIDYTSAKIKTLQWVTTWVALVVFTCLAALNNWGAGAFSPDSWTYFELSQTIMSDFYNIKHFRSYWTSDYSAAFPPLWPTIIFLANTITNLGPDVAIFLNILILFLIAVVADSIAKASFNVSGPGVLMALVLLVHPGFFSELFAGRSIPLFVLLGLTALRLIIVKNAGHKTLRFFTLGVVLAAMFMTRFDGALWVIVLFPFMLFLNPGRHGVLAFWAAYATGISPWVLYSVTHFNVALVSDNSWVARALDPNAFTTDYPAAQGPTIFDNIGFVISTVIGRMPDLMYALVRSPGRFGILIFAIFLVLLVFSAPWRRSSIVVLGRSQAMPFIVVGLAIISATPSYLLTGYFDARYFSFLFAFAIFLLLIGVWHDFRSRALGRILALTVSLISVAIALTFSSGRSSTTQIDLPYESELAICLGLKPDHKPILVDNDIQGARLAALYGVRVASLPANFLRGESDPAMHEVFLNAYGIEYALGASGRIARVFGVQRLSVVPGCGLDIFRILPLETPALQR